MKNVAGFHSFELGFLVAFIDGEEDFRSGFGIKLLQKEA